MGKQRKRIGDLISIERFHEEVKNDALYRDDIFEEEIIIFDVSVKFKHKKSKYDTYNVLINMAFASNEKEIFNCFVSGEVIVEQLEKLKELGELPSDDGILMKLIKNENYYKFV